ncbi:MAG TPA: rod shape-determining protein [Candidatus Spyradocola merdavium]|nr:rod shape-determining protein [Candidatus Spyradocola merdavium]
MALGVKFMSRNMGFDLGTANIVVYVDGKGIVLREPTMVAVRSDARRQVLAVGEEAKKMMGRTPSNITAIHPVTEGVIADLDSTQVMIKYLIHKANDFSVPIVRPRVVVCVPCGITPVERQAVEQVVRNAGARSVHLVDEPMAAAIGAGLPVEEASGSMVVDIGGGTSEMAVLSMNGVVTSCSVRTAGQKMDEAIINFIKNEYNLLIGERTAEEVKIGIGSAIPLKRRETVMVRGRDLITGLPHMIEISNDEITEALKDPLGVIMNNLRTCLENTPPELASDIMERGIYLTGGGAQLSGLDLLISQQTGMPVVLADNPMDCVAIGTGILSGDLERLKHITRVAEEA